MRDSHPACHLASNWSLKGPDLETAMAGKGEKSGRKGRPGKNEVRVVKGKGGNRRLEEEKEVCGTMLEEGRALIGNKEEGWEIVEGLVRSGDFWGNGEVRIRCGKKGLEDSVWKVWEEVEMVDTFEEKGEREGKEKGGKGKGKEGVEEGETEERRIKKEKGVENMEVVEISSGSEEDSGVGLIEEWKVKKEARERRERSEKKKREVEGMINRGKDREMGRKKIMEMKQNFKD